MLTPASCLFYWEARDDAIPVIGGDPHHTRNTAGTWLDRRGRLQTAIVNTPRTEWLTINGVDRPVLRLEHASTNTIRPSKDFSHANWTKETGVTVTGGKPDPAGGTNGFTVATSVGANAVFANIDNGPSMVRYSSLWVRRRSGGGAVRLVTPDAGRSADLAPLLTSRWQRCAAAGAAAITRYAGVALGTAGDLIDIYGAQTDEGDVTSYIDTLAAAAGSRAIDQFYWDFEHQPQAFVAYLRMVHLDPLDAGVRVRWRIGKDDASGYYAQIYQSATTLVAVHGRDAGAVESAVTIGPIAAAAGSLLEVIYSLDATGRVAFNYSLAGAAVVESALGSALALNATWGDTRLWLNSVGPNYPGLGQYSALKIVKAADVVGGTGQQLMDELREFELNASGEKME